MTNPDYRAMCAELLCAMDEIAEYEVVDWAWVKTQPLKMASQSMAEARALLAQPEPEGPTDEELLASVRHFYGDQTAADMGAEDDLRTARAVLAHWGRTTPHPEPEDRSQISDGYHTFAELYAHRHALMLALMRAMPGLCWFSQHHSDGELPFGSADWFIVGAHLPTGTITYHLPIELLPLARQTGAAELAVGRPWDGHTANDVIERLRDWAILHQPEPEGFDDKTREAVLAAVSEALGGGAYDCLRVWSAWGYGTMGPDDFSLVSEDDDRVAEIADAAIQAIRPTPQPEEVQT